MRQRLRLLVLVVMTVPGLVPGAGSAQTSAGDSLRPFPLDAVIITSTRMSTPAERVPMKTTVITRAMIADGNGTTLGDALKLSPGLVVREYGGGGGIQTLSFRGGSSEQTLLLVDGVPVSALQTGVLDLRMFPLEEVESIEVVRGGMSSLYGANAMGGMLNLKTVPPAGPSSVRVRASTGSFGTEVLSASARAAFDGLTLSGGVERERSAGDYPFHSVLAGAERSAIRTNSDYRIDHAFLRADWTDAERDRTSIDVSATQSDRGSPGPVVGLADQGDGRQSDLALRATGFVERQITSRLRLSAAGTIQRADEHYADATGVFRGDNYYRNAIIALSPVLRFEPTRDWTLVSGWDVDRAAADGNALPGRIERSHAAWFAASEIRLDSSNGEQASVAFLPAVRYETFSSMHPLWNPQAGVRARFRLGRLGAALHGSAGRSFRIPTMNELHYSGAGGFGNPALVPEVAVSFDAGVTLSSDILGREECDATFYAVRTDDRIFWQPAGSALVWSPVNIARTVARGFELEAGWTAASGVAEARATYAYVDSRNRSGSPADNPLYDRQLPYIPLETATLAVQLRLPLPRSGAFRSLALRFADEYLGQRYTSDDNSTSLPAEHVLGANVALSLGLLDGTAVVKYELENLSDRDLQGMPGYPLPLQHHRLSFTFEHHFGEHP